MVRLYGDGYCSFRNFSFEFYYGSGIIICSGYEIINFFGCMLGILGIYGVISFCVCFNFYGIYCMVNLFEYVWSIK